MTEFMDDLKEAAAEIAKNKAKQDMRNKHRGK